MERLLYDDRRVIHPAGLAGMRERTVTVGSASKELRMIGWRVGWIVGPEQLMPDIAAVSIANCVVPVGIAQDAAAIALVDSRTSLAGYVAELERRRDLLLDELKGLPCGVPAGGWSMLLRVSDFGLDGARMSERLLDRRHRGHRHAGVGRGSRRPVHPLRLLQRAFGSFAWGRRQGEARARLLARRRVSVGLDLGGLDHLAPTRQF